MTHYLKIHPYYYKDVVAGKKKAEVRENKDNRFNEGDKIELMEWNDLFKRYTGRRVVARITHVYHGQGLYGLDVGYSVLSIELLEEGE